MLQNFPGTSQRHFPEFLWPRRIVVPSGAPPTNPKPLLSRVALNAQVRGIPCLMPKER
jgi:hypothetical protein